MSTRFKFVACVLGVLIWCGAAFGAKHQIWVEVQTPNFTIISNASDKTAEKTALQFEQIRTLFRQSLKFASYAHTPQITVLAVKDENSMRQLLPEYWSKGHAHPAGIFLGRMDQFYAAVQLDAPGDNPYEAFYHEYYHSLSIPYFPGMPVWLAEGLADFFGNTYIEGNKAYMGQPSEALLEELKQGGIIPLDVLFRVDHSSPYYNEANRTSKFYAESWALVHFLLLGDREAHRQLLFNYLNEFDHGATPEEAIKAFGNLADLQQELQYYIGGSQFSGIVAPAPAKIAATELRVRELSDAEVDAEIGGFEAARGKYEQADPLLQEAVRLDPKLALGYQNLALADFFQGQRDQALTAVSQAIALDPKNSTAHYIRAYLTVGTERSTTQGDQFESDLREAIAANPDFAPASALLAVYLSATPDKLPEALNLAKQAVILEPGSASFQFDLGQVLLRMHRYDEAKAAILSARNESANAAERAQAEQLLSFVEQMKTADEDAGSAQHGNDSEADAQSNTNPQPGPTGTAAVGGSSVQTVTGIVKQMSCVNGIQLTVDAAAGTYRLSVPPGQQLQFVMHFRPKPGFNPCSSLKGLQVKASYEPDAKGTSGTLERLDILSP